MANNMVAEALVRDVLLIARTLRKEKNQCINIATLTFLELLDKGYQPELVVGSLKCNDKTIFECPSDFRYVHLTGDIEFDGHIWVECAGLIIDIAIMFSIMNMQELQKFLFIEGFDFSNPTFCTPVSNVEGSGCLSYEKHLLIQDPNVIRCLKLGALNWLKPTAH
ncbi:hypothetical protein Q4601_07900 [Shewanella sp. 1_MG-2023]|uniref:hypothetical protein n=1 Tax=unclassified Shewanella TaxID=196818 RepID=UPI0026E428D5|nr:MULTISPECIES: hypothetical protein [unclassified Shewanella]MDO6612042.1 hypothetical protein [Shewanella sp. 7_MG-2023]MDO6771882.1 hypothetical protein [Shewanella sp. 2_MG-2023]MDO6794226.1 hypothetical protein [Shewanella sp. 1_MG-2023]